MTRHARDGCWVAGRLGTQRLGLTLGLSCLQLAQAQPFSDATRAAGFDYSHGYRAVGSTLSERHKVAGGVAAGDIDNDGLVDLYVVRGDRGPNLLFKNLGDGTFRDIAAGAGVAIDNALGAGPLFADLDSDGDLDLFVGGFAGSPTHVFRNDGGAGFTDVTTASGLATSSVFGASAGDYDRDGDLDLFLSRWIDGDSQLLWQNQGDGTFRDVSAVALPPMAFPYVFTANFSDIDNDGWADLLLTGDFASSQVLRNRRDGRFELFTDAAISDENGMGAAVGDIDNDGDMDWFVSSIWDSDGVAERNWGVTGNRLYQNRGDGRFRDVTDAAGVRAGYWGWGSCFADFNNDGHLDLFHVNGFALRPEDVLEEDAFERDPSRLFINDGSGRFTEQSARWGLLDTDQGRGVVCFDADRDGDIDLFVANNSAPPRFYRNESQLSNHYLTVRLHAGGVFSATGARVTITRGQTLQTREIRAGSNYASQNPAEAHFGLGPGCQIDSLHILWPDGYNSTRKQVVCDQYLLLSDPRLPSFGDGFEQTERSPAETDGFAPVARD